jgi:amidase
LASGDEPYVIPSEVEGQPPADVLAVDVLVLPTMPVPTLTLEQGSDAKAAIPMTAFVRPFNLSGHPALTIPLPAANGFSAGLQLVGRRGADAELLAVARVIERAVAARVTA